MKTNFIRYHMSRQKFKSVVTETLQTPLKKLSHKNWNICVGRDLITCTKFIIRDLITSKGIRILLCANLLGITVHSSLRQAAKYSGDFAQPQCSKEFVRIFDCDRYIYYILLGFRSLVMSAILIIRLVICLSFLSSSSGILLYFATIQQWLHLFLLQSLRDNLLLCVLTMP